MPTLQVIKFPPILIAPRTHTWRTTSLSVLDRFLHIYRWNTETRSWTCRTSIKDWQTFVEAVIPSIHYAEDNGLADSASERGYKLFRSICFVRHSLGDGIIPVLNRPRTFYYFYEWIVLAVFCWCVCLNIGAVNRGGRQIFNCFVFFFIGNRLSMRLAIPRLSMLGKFFFFLIFWYVRFLSSLLGLLSLNYVDCLDWDCLKDIIPLNWAEPPSVRPWCDDSLDLVWIVLYFESNLWDRELSQVFCA